ncbi:MAG: phospholipase [Chloroflexi bacterium UTCFX4]|nr:MAG: phospholipase [Chloroflexi bacterium UTCFX4]
MSSQNYHQDQPIYRAGEPLETARAVMLMLHGRGASAQDILSLAEELPRDGFCFLAPQAANATWYPFPFMQPLEKNEPWLSSALNLVDALVTRVRAANIPHEKIFLLGFSQGACLALEYAARHAQKYGGIIGLSGGLIGPDDTPRDYAGSFDRTPVFLGCSDVDFHIPKERVMETRAVLARMGAEVTMRLYPNMEHTVNQDEVEFAKALMELAL